MMTRLKMLWVVLTARSFVVALRADLGSNPLIKAERVLFHRVRNGRPKHFQKRKGGRKWRRK